MKLLLSTMLVFALAGCSGHNMDGHMNHEYNPLGGSTITTVTPSSSAQDDNMIAVQATIKRLVNEKGIKDAYLYWVINDAQRKDNMAVYDITIKVEDLHTRYIFGLTDGKVDMVQEIEVEAEVDCQHEGRQYEGREQA